MNLVICLYGIFLKTEIIELLLKYYHVNPSTVKILKLLKISSGDNIQKFVHLQHVHI